LSLRTGIYAAEGEVEFPERAEVYMFRKAKKDSGKVEDQQRKFQRLRRSKKNYMI